MKKTLVPILLCILAAMVAFAGCASQTTSEEDAATSAVAEEASQPQESGAVVSASATLGTPAVATTPESSAPSASPTQRASTPAAFDMEVAQNGTSAKAVEANETGDVTIGLSIPNLADPLYADVAQGIAARCDELGYALVTRDANGDATQQVSHFESFLNQDVTAVIASAVDGADLADAAQALNDAGIILISFGPQVPYANEVFAIDEYSYGQQLGEWAATFSRTVQGGVSNILILTDDSKVDVGDRADGMQDAILRDIPDPMILDRAQQTTKEGGKQATQAALEELPDLNVILATTDEAAEGALEAMEEAQLSEAQQDDIFIGCISSSQAGFELVAEKRMFRATVGLPRAKAATSCVNAVQGMIEAMSVPVRENVQKTYWPPMLVAYPAPPDRTETGAAVHPVAPASESTGAPQAEASESTASPAP